MREYCKEVLISMFWVYVLLFALLFLIILIGVDRVFNLGLEEEVFVGGGI